jgi:hypothetical protein
VDRDHGLGGAGDPLGAALEVEQAARLVDVDEARAGAGRGDRLGGRDERVGGKYDLLARANARGA